MMTDPIADFLTRIRNGLSAEHKTISCGVSKMKTRLAQTLKDEGYISDFEVTGQGIETTLTVTLKYDAEERPIIEGIKRVSRPGLRIYRRVDDLPQVLGGMGCAIISTSKGLMTAKEARIKRLGGEVLCQVW